MDVDSFLSANEEKYKTLTYFQDLLNNITDETFPSVIQYVEERTEFFFKDRESCILFLSCIVNFSVCKFKEFHLIQDVFIEFSMQVKEKGIDEHDIIDLNTLYSLNYLYEKNIISIESLYRKSISNPAIFINFFNEIDSIDHEYAMTRADEILNDTDHSTYEEKYLSFLNQVITNLEEHENNRRISYHSSHFHKTIRDDDIDTFQSILSKNNYSVNYKFEKSYYERALTEEDNPTLIQVSAIYGSIQIFKFLWMQPDILITENLIDYAVSGRNIDIIHICETKCPLRRALKYSIATHQNELSEYIIDHTDTKEELDNIYSRLSYSEMKTSLEYLNYDVIIGSLTRIVSIVKRYDNYDELEQEDHEFQNSFFSLQIFDMNLFKFLYSHKNPNFSFFEGSNPVFSWMLENKMYDALHYLIQYLNPKQLYRVFESSIRLNPKIAIYLMNLQIDEIKNNDEHPIYDSFKKEIGTIGDYIFILAADYFDFEVMPKLLNLYYVIDSPEDFLGLFPSLSTKMINSLFSNKLTFSSKETIFATSTFLNECGMTEASALILKYNQ